MYSIHNILYLEMYDYGVTSYFTSTGPHMTLFVVMINYCTMAVFRVEEVRADKDSLSPIEEDSARISIPGEVLEGATEGAPVRMASFLFRNMSGLLPESLNNSDGAQNDNMLVFDDRIAAVTS
jgi:hypothetical protein